MNARTRSDAMRLAKARRDALHFGAPTAQVERLVAAGDVHELEELASRALHHVMTDSPRISMDLARSRAAKGGKSRGAW